MLGLYISSSKLSISFETYFPVNVHHSSAQLPNMNVYSRILFFLCQPPDSVLIRFVLRVLHQCVFVPIPYWHRVDRPHELVSKKT